MTQAQKTLIAQLVNGRQTTDQAPTKRRRCMSHFDQRVVRPLPAPITSPQVLVLTTNVPAT
jgi:hypothetical protein